MPSWPWNFGTQPGGPGTTVNASKIDDNFNAAQFAAGGASVDGTFALWNGTGGNQLKAGGFTFTTLTNSLGGDVTLNNVANYFDGPSVAQGTSGTWIATGAVVLGGTGLLNAGDIFDVKMWDGTTIIASTQVTYAGPSGSAVLQAALSGTIINPAGNLRISAKCTTNTTVKILFNQSGNSKDSTITALRVA